MATAHCNGGSRLTIGTVASRLNLSPSHVRNLVADGSLRCSRLTNGNASWRTFRERDICEFLNLPIPEDEQLEIHDEKPVLIYARKSDHSQKEGLKTQIQDLVGYAGRELRKDEKDLHIFSDIGSGLNFKRPQFCRMLEEISKGKYDGGILLITYFDRLSRLGFESFQLILKARNIKIVCIKDKPEGEQDDPAEGNALSLAMAVMQVCCSSIYGSRSAEKTRVVVDSETIKKALELHKSGLTWRGIAQTIKELGFRDSKGREIKFGVLRRECLKLKDSLGDFVEEVNTTAQQFIKDCINQSGNEKKDRIKFKELEKIYLVWCVQKQLKPLNSGKLSAQFNSILKNKLISNVRNYLGVIVQT